MNREQQEREEQELEIKIRTAHRDAKLDIAAVLSTLPGRRFIKYLFDSLDVGMMPDQLMEGTILHDRLGFLRAGNSIFKLVAEASPEAAGLILAELEKERYDELVRKNSVDA